MQRARLLEELKSPEPFDIAIIGGGAVGLGAAVEASSRGYRTLLIEQDDFCKGTSSRSTKLIHGGVRYLRQGNLSLVREALRERGLLLANAPHLVERLPLVLHCSRWWERPFYWLGLRLYDHLAGDLGLGPSRSLSAVGVRRRLPSIRSAGQRGGVLFYDAQFDDARLGLCLARTASDLGAVILNHMRAEGLEKSSQGRIQGLRLRDTLGPGGACSVRCRTVINATGPFSDAVRRMDNRGAAERVTVSRGSHIVLDSSFLPSQTALLVPRTADGRVIFLIPWQGVTLVGTTDLPEDEPSMDPRPRPEEIDYLLEYAGRYLSRAPRREDILSTFCGLRPLVKARPGEKTSAISREHSVEVSDSGLVSVMGGKWTTYRKMAADVVAQAVQASGLPERPGNTERLKLHGAKGRSAVGGLFAAYGSDAEALQKAAAQRPQSNELLHPRLPYRKVQVTWAVEAEMAMTVEDVLARRTRSLFLDARGAGQAAEKTAGLMAPLLDWDQERCRAEVEGFQETARRYLP